MRNDDAQSHSEIDCQAAIERLWEYLDDELDQQSFAGVEAHLETCAKCPSHFAFAAMLLREIRASRAMQQESGLLRKRVLHALRAEGFQGVAS